MAEPLTPEWIAELRDELDLKRAAGLTSVPMYFDDYAALLDAAERAAKLCAENERLLEALGRMNAQLDDQIERINRLNEAQDRINTRLAAALAEGGVR